MNKNYKTQILFNSKNIFTLTDFYSILVFPRNYKTADASSIAVRISSCIDLCLAGNITLNTLTGNVKVSNNSTQTPYLTKFLINLPDNKLTAKQTINYFNGGSMTIKHRKLFIKTFRNKILEDLENKNCIKRTKTGSLHKHCEINLELKKKIAQSLLDYLLSEEENIVLDCLTILLSFTGCLTSTFSDFKINYAEIENLKNKVSKIKEKIKRGGGNLEFKSCVYSFMSFI